MLNREIDLLRENTTIYVHRPSESFLTWNSQVEHSGNADSGPGLTATWREKRKGRACQLRFCSVLP